MNGRATVFTTARPVHLGKTFALKPDGTVEKTVAGSMSEGTHHQVQFSTATELAGLLESVTTSQALSSSVAVAESTGRVVTEKALSSSPGAVARSKRFFHLPPTPGLLCLDHDLEPGKPALDAATLFALLCQIVPDAAQAGVVAYPSGSSLIYEGDKQHRGIAGMHLYVLISDLSNTQQFGQTLSKRLWLAGHGRIDIGASGAMLNRTKWDEAVHQPARLLFAGGAVCGEGLEQRRGDPVILSDGGFLDTRTACPDLSPEEEGRYLAILESAKVKARPAADRARQAWIEARTKEGLTKAVNAGEDLTEAKARIARDLDAALGGSLPGSYLVTIIDDDGKERDIPVDQVLADRDRYHLKVCLDPINPDHRDRATDAILYLNQPQPVIYSLDNGGTIYRLLSQPLEIALAAGSRAQVAEAIATAIAKDDDVFLIAGQPVQVFGEKVFPLPLPLLAHRIGHKVSLYRQGKDKKIRVDPDMPLVQMVAALLPQMLRPIVGRSTIPLVTTSGRVINTPGFDNDTGLFLALRPDDCQSINPTPSSQETVDALQRLWRPFSRYRWAATHDRAAMLATILTVVVRPTMLASFGTFVSATTQGSGKTKATEAVLALVTGERGGLVTWKSDDEQELLKLLFSMVLSGSLGVIFDNVVKVFSSPVLCSAIMAGTITARVLGVSQERTAPARLMWLASGNGVSMDRDQAERWLIAHIDVACERPGDLHYPFDPVQVALNDRQGIARACITVHRAYHEAGRPEADNVPTRIAEWGRSIRHLVLWLRDSGIAAEAGIDIGDPTHCMTSAAASVDSETESFGMILQGCQDLFSRDPFTASQVRTAFDRGASGGDEGEQLIHEGLAGLMPNARPGFLSPQAVNAVLKNRRGRIVGGLKVETVKQYGPAANRGAYWQIVPAAAA